MDLATTSLIALLKVVIVLFGVILPGASACVYLERKISAWIQLRIGPNRVGPLGLLQPIADVVKLMLKEDIVPKAADKNFHFLAPMLSITVSIAMFAILPFGDYIMIGDTMIHLSIAPGISVGVLLLLALTSVGVYGITLAGWASNSKYSLLGGLRSASQMISYELSMGLSIVGIIMLSGTLDLNEIIQHQADHGWNILYQPLAFIIFLVASYAETNRAPFDLPEAEPELVGGFHTEYSGMKFGIFFLAEYAAMIAASALMVILFFGGWHAPGLGIPAVANFLADFGIVKGSLVMGLIELGTFTVKLGFFIVLFIWVRWSIPRFRYDQLMNLGWKVLLPLSLLNLVLTAFIYLAFFD